VAEEQSLQSIQTRLSIIIMVGVLRNGGLMSPQAKQKQPLPSQIEDEEEEDLGLGLDLDELPMATQEAFETVARTFLQQQQEEHQQRVHAKLSPLHPLKQEGHNISYNETNKIQVGLEERLMELEAKLATLALLVHEQQAQINQQKIQLGHHAIRQSISPTMGRGGPLGGMIMTPPDSPLLSSMNNHANSSFIQDDDDNSNDNNKGGQDMMTRAGPLLDSPAAPQSRRHPLNRRDHSRRRNLSFKLLYQQSEFPQPHEVYSSDSQGSIDDEDGDTTGDGDIGGEERQNLNEQTTATTSHDTVTRMSSTMADTTSSAASTIPTASYGPNDATPRKTNTAGGRSRSSSIISNGSMQEPPADFFDKLSESMAQSNSILVGEEHYGKGGNLYPPTTPSLLLSSSSTSASPYSGPRSMPLLDDPMPLLSATGGVDLHAFGLRKRDISNGNSVGATTTGDAALTSNATGAPATTPLIRTMTAPAVLTASTTTAAIVAICTSTSSEFFVTPKVLHHSTSTTSVEGSASINNNNSNNNTKNAASTKSNLRLKWLDYLNSFQETSYDVDLQMEEFVKVPSAVEKLLSFGFWICVDSFLDCLTILPIRAAWGCLLLQRYVVLKATIHRHTEIPDGPYRFHRR
jgi:hypothetical protein